MNAHIFDAIDLVGTAAENALAFLSVISDDLALIAKDPCEKGITEEEITKRKSIMRERMRNSARDSIFANMCIDKLITIQSAIDELLDSLKQTAE